MYNSVGGWPLAHYDERGKRTVANALLRSSFLSVRDENSAAILHAIDPRLSPRVAPDLVFLLPALLPLEELHRNAGPWFGETIPRLGRFLCFQCNPRFGEANRAELASQLTRLREATGLPILLLPIGGIYPFEDRRFLQPFAADLGPSAHIPPEVASVFDTAYALASCSLFCGTSLHGIITALTFGSPFVALENEDPKVPLNIESWGLQPSFPAVASARLAAQAHVALASDRSWLDAEVNRLQQAAAANLEHLARAIG
jgi:polysaccharide pyruvyl transferase WcaK-like protein